MVVLTLSTISDYLTEEVIAETFKTHTDNEDNVKSISITTASEAGNGLLSALYRIRVIGNQYTACFVAKALVSDALLRRSLDVEKYFKREFQFFSTVLPTLAEIQKALGAKESILKHIPMCYSLHCDGLQDYILMEDLAESQCLSVSECPTEDQRNAILDTLAHLHAVSLALRIKRPMEFNKIKKELPELNYTEQNRTWYARYIRNGIDICKGALAEFEDPANSPYYKKYSDLVDSDAYRELINIVVPGRHAVICHGDVWCMNFLCSKERAVAIDFQLLRLGSLAGELSFFIMICSNLIQNKCDFLKAVTVYYNSLTYYLQDMGIDVSEVFSWNDLTDELKTYGKYAILAASTTIPLMCSERCDVLQSFETKYAGRERIPLEELWPLTPFKDVEQKMKFVKLVRIAVDLGMI